MRAGDPPDDPPEEAVTDVPVGEEPVTDDPPVLSAREAARRGVAGWPPPGDPFPPPPVPLPAGRGGDQVVPRPLHATAGRPAPWAALDRAERRLRLEQVRRILAGAGPPVRSEREGMPGIDRASAVLAPLYEDGSELHVVLTRRTWDLRSHQGEVSFPGGRQDEGEDLPGTALREANEEIALDPGAVEIVGELDHLATVTSRSFIVPYVGSLSGVPELEPNPAEVEAVLHVPIAELLDPAIFREERWRFPNGQERAIFFFELVGDTVWGATGAMLRQLLGLLTDTVGRGQLDHL
jgi:8-oxo-dGTP pyrophosphatase MutT (NUDIX family)